MLTVFRDLMPPLFFMGLGPQWTRVAAVMSDAATDTATVSLLLESYLPPIYYDPYASDSFTQVTEPSPCVRPH